MISASIFLCIAIRNLPRNFNEFYDFPRFSFRINSTWYFCCSSSGYFFRNFFKLFFQIFSREFSAQPEISPGFFFMSATKRIHNNSHMNPPDYFLGIAIWNFLEILPVTPHGILSGTLQRICTVFILLLSENSNRKFKTKILEDFP